MSSWWGVGEVLWHEVQAALAPTCGAEPWQAAQLSSVGAGMSCPGAWHDQQEAPVVVLPGWQFLHFWFGTCGSGWHSLHFWNEGGSAWWQAAQSWAAP